jgi:putative addiction module component (TIGR02574 family)
MNKESILEQIKALSKAEQMEIAMELWDSVDEADLTFSLTPELKAELDRRIAADDADLTPATDWAVLRAELLRGEI